MDRERQRQIEQLYHEVLKQEPARRAAYLTEACENDHELRGEVESWLAHHSTAVIDPPTCEAAPKLPDSSAVLTTGMQLGPYQILGPLGEGGMGKVYRGLDTRLNRPVAIKISTEQFNQRFEREARMISALNHPNVCTLYDVGSLPSGSGYMVTELVDGETLREWLKRAPAIDRSLEIAQQVLEALRAAHGAGIVHRDLKPANIMVRFDGYVKVLDFGLAKHTPASRLVHSEETATGDVSLPGQITGTIAYMSPEQILGQELDPRSDLFAFGIVLYEMLTGGHPWPRASKTDTLRAILLDEPAPIRDAALAGLDSVLRQLLRKSPGERYPSAAAVLEALAKRTDRPAPHTETRAPTRLIALPFRMLRRHDAFDFLSISLPEAIASSLAAIDSLVVRSMLVASRFAASPELDVKLVAEQAHVDAILTGTILSDGERLRVHTQLVEAPAGSVLWSNTSQVSLQDIFQLQDQLVDRIIQSLTLPLTAREKKALKHDVPASAMAYELYLRANQLVAGGGLHDLFLARDLYLRSLEADPNYAPAWAWLGRTCRVLGKFGEDQAANAPLAEEAFRKAFALNPDLALTHNFYTTLETDSGRSLEAMERLLKRARSHRNDPHLLTGLVQACRYCGLLKASVAAHDRARQLDPDIRTSVAYTYLHLGEFQEALDYCGPADGFVAFPAFEALGQAQKGIAICREAERTLPPQPRMWTVVLRACLEGDRQVGLDSLEQALEIMPTMMDDPEARFCTACVLAKLNDPERALEFLFIALDRGYRCHHALLHDRWLESLRSHAHFAALVNRAAAMDLEAQTIFRANGGDRLLV
jgi:serine/threonine protein kinase